MSIIPHTCDAGGFIGVEEIGGTIFLSEGLLWKWGAGGRGDCSYT